MPPLSVLMEMAFLLQISAYPIEVNFNADMNEKPENIYSIYYPTITTRWVISTIFTHSEWVILSKTTHSEWAFLEKRLLFTFYLASTEPHFLRLLRSEGVIDSLSLITYLPLRIAKGEMDGNNVVTYMMHNLSKSNGKWIWEEWTASGWEWAIFHNSANCQQSKAEQDIELFQLPNR